MDDLKAPPTVSAVPPEGLRDCFDAGNVSEWFQPKTPSADQAARYAAVHHEGREFAVFLDSMLPVDCREKQLALEKVQEVVQWCEAAIARHPVA